MRERSGGVPRLIFTFKSPRNGSTKPMDEKADIVPMLFAMRGELSALTARVEGLQTAVNDIRDHKVDRKDVKSLFPLAWIFRNWKLAATVLFVASSAGFVSFSGGLGHLIKILGGPQCRKTSVFFY